MTAATKRFAKLMPKGWDRLDSLFQLKGGPTVGRLYAFLGKHAGHDNALAVSNETLAEALNVHVRSVIRAAAVLVSIEALAVVKVGTGNVYILNPDEVWRGADDHKRFCGFRAKVLIGFKENEGLRRRISHFLPQPDLIEDAAESEDAA